MSYPTTLISTKICLTTLRNALEACEKDGQLGDTFRFDAVHGSNDLELFEADLDIWVFSETPTLEKKDVDDKMRCRFEHFRSGIIMKHEFEFPIPVNEIDVNYAWSLLKYCFDHIEKKDITTRVMSLKMFLGQRKRPVATYRVGAQVKT